MSGRSGRVVIAVVLVLGLAAGGATMWWRRGLRDSVLAEEIKTFAWMELAINTSVYSDGFDAKSMEVKQLSVNHGTKTFEAVLRIPRTPLRLGLEAIPLEGQDGAYEGRVSGTFGEKWEPEKNPFGVDFRRPMAYCLSITFPEDPILRGDAASEARWKKGDMTPNELFDSWVNFAHYSDEGEELPRHILCLLTMQQLRREGKFEDAIWLRNYATTEEEPWKTWMSEEIARVESQSRE